MICVPALAFCVLRSGATKDTLKSEVAEMQVQMKRAGEDREKENKADIASHVSQL